MPTSSGSPCARGSENHMLASTPEFERNALNRITFGAREADVALVEQMGWNAWVADQLSPPAGDDPDLANHIAQLTMPIVYDTQPPFGGNPGWPAVAQNRPLLYLKADLATLWDLTQR